MPVISFPWQQGGGQNGGIHEDYTMPLTKDQTLAVATFSTPAIGDIREDDVSSTISRNTRAGGETQNPAFVVAPSLTAANDPSRSPQSSEVTQQVAAVLQSSMQVRRLTPVECARLQGFPDTYLDIPYRNKPAADGPKYKALGNSMAVPVMSWIGQRIQLVHDALEEQ